MKVASPSKECGALTGLGLLFVFTLYESLIAWVLGLVMAIVGISTLCSYKRKNQLALYILIPIQILIALTVLTLTALTSKHWLNMLWSFSVLSLGVFSLYILYKEKNVYQSH